MAATIQISLPDELVDALDASPSELPRRTLEALVAQCYRSGQITHAQAARALSLDRWQTDKLLKDLGAQRAGSDAEFSSDAEEVRRLSNR